MKPTNKILLGTLKYYDLITRTGLVIGDDGKEYNLTGGSIVSNVLENNCRVRFLLQPKRYNTKWSALIVRIERHWGKR